MECRTFIFSLVFCWVILNEVGTLNARNPRNTRIRRASRYSQLGLTTPAAIYSDGHNALNSPNIVPAITFMAPPLIELRLSCPPSWEESSANGGPHDGQYKCRPQPDLWRICFENNPCGPNSECDVTNGTRECSCMSSYRGSPPKCKPGSVHSVCRGDPCGAYSECDAHRENICQCVPGFIGETPNCTAGPTLLARCNPYPCGGYATCQQKNGNAVCACLEGYIGNPPDCKPGPEMWRVCFKDRPCGYHSQCGIKQRTAVCGPCEAGSVGEPPFCALKVRGR